MKVLSVISVMLVLLTACAQDKADSPKAVTEEVNLVLAGFENHAGQDLLIEGLARHEAGKYEEALIFFDAAYEKFEAMGDTNKMAEVLSAKTLTFRRQEKLAEAVLTLEQAIALTEGTGGVVLPLYNLAKVQEQLEDAQCVATYQQALAAMEEYQPAPHYRPAVINDMKLHLAVAQLLFDQDPGNAEANALEAIEALKSDAELDEFARMVWVSGGYLGLARYYIPRDAERAWSYFDQAEQVIMAYPDETVLRRQDLETLRAEMPARP